MLRYRRSTQSKHAGKATLETPSPDMLMQQRIVYPIRLGVLPVEVSSLVEGKGFERREIWTVSPAYGRSVTCRLHLGVTPATSRNINAAWNLVAVGTGV
jgi:hypothetical protein